MMVWASVSKSHAKVFDAGHVCVSTVPITGSGHIVCTTTPPLPYQLHIAPIMLDVCP